jgi:hypothetical protein
MTAPGWYARHDCTHAHCPRACPKPQPAEMPDGRLLCSRCLVLEGIEIEMVPCTPETCAD